MVIRYLLLIALAASGCASFQPQAYSYKKLGISLVCAPETTVDTVCRGSAPLFTDKGKPYPRFYPGYTDRNGFWHQQSVMVPACFKSREREIWMKWGDWCNTMSHELCHAEGLDNAYCEDHYPEGKI